MRSSCSKPAPLAVRGRGQPRRPGAHEPAAGRDRSEHPRAIEHLMAAARRDARILDVGTGSRRHADRLRASRLDDRRRRQRTRRCWPSRARAWRESTSGRGHRCRCPGAALRGRCCRRRAQLAPDPPPRARPTVVMALREMRRVSRGAGWWSTTSDAGSFPLAATVSDGHGLRPQPRHARRRHGLRAPCLHAGRARRACSPPPA